MQDRYSLRFENGERKGEIVPVPAGRSTVGRRPGNALQIVEGSVSGQHAELFVDEDGVRVVDLGSTNGTQVGGRRVDEERCAHGDRVAFGHVLLTLIDAKLGDARPLEEDVSDAVADVGESVGHVSAESVAKSGRRSKAGALFVALALVLVAGGTWTVLRRGDAGPRTSPVVAVPANLLAAGYSFEDPDAPWAGDEEASAVFLPSAQARVSGRTGMRAELAEGERALLVSADVPVGDGRTLSAFGALSASGGAGGRIGVEFSRGDPTDPAAPGPLFAWSEWIGADSAPGQLTLTAPVPPGARVARVLVEARAGALLGGAVGADDVGVTSALGVGAPALQDGEFRVYLLGRPAQAAAIYKVGRALLGDLHASPAGGGAGAPGAVELALEQGPGRYRVALAGGGSERTLLARVEPAALDQGMATVGPGGYRKHGPEFEREEVTTLLIGKERDQLALRFDPALSVRAVAEGGGARLRVSLGSAGGFELQLDFKEERGRASGLAYGARQAEGDGRLGECLKAWAELLDQYPFEEKLVEEAEGVRARLVQAGLQELESVRAEVERARFFRLVDLYRQCRDQARAVGRRYAGTEVEGEAQGVVAAVDSLLVGLESELDRDEIARLRSIRDVLAASGSSALAAELGTYLSEEYGAED